MYTAGVHLALNASWLTSRHVHPKSAIYGGSIGADWYGPHWAVSQVRMGVLFFVSSRGLCNAMSQSSAPAHYLCKECGTDTVSGYLLSGDPERDPN